MKRRDLIKGCLSLSAITCISTNKILAKSIQQSQVKYLSLEAQEIKNLVIPILNRYYFELFDNITIQNIKHDINSILNKSSVVKYGYYKDVNMRNNSKFNVWYLNQQFNRWCELEFEILRHQIVIKELQLF